MIEALKLVFNVLVRDRSGEEVPRQMQRNVLWDASQDFEEQPLQGLANQECEETTVTARDVVGQEPTDAWTTRSQLTVVLASVVWASTTYTVRLLSDHLRSRRLIEFIQQFSTALLFFDAATVHFASAISIILVLYGLYAFVGRGVTATVSQTIALQVRCHVSPCLLVISHDGEQLLGVLLAKTALSHPSLSHVSPSAILLAVAYTSACNVLMIDKVPITLPLFALALTPQVDSSSPSNNPRQKV